MQDRFWNKVELIPFHECWEWVGHKMKNGYGQLYKNHKLRLAHRVSYELFVKEIPNGLDIDHLCRNRGCVNPKHLEPVTRRENLRRSPLTSIGKTPPTHCSKGHSLSGNNVVIYNGTSQRCRECCRVRARKNYKYVKKNVPKIQKQ